MVLSLPTWDTFLEQLNKLFILSVTQGVFTVKDQEIHLTSETLTQTNFTTQKAKHKTSESVWQILLC